MSEDTGASGTGSVSTGDTADGSSTGADPGDDAGASSSGGGTQEDLDATAEDFTCILDWAKVRRFRVTNLLGRLDEAVEVANAPAGGTYPVGTIIQLIPGEAMVKRAQGWSPETGDWEFFSLGTSAQGTEILDRGTTDVVNQFNGNCYGCHSKAEPQWDFVCESDHGCDPLPLTPEQIELFQNSDPRCG